MKRKMELMNPNTTEKLSGKSQKKSKKTTKKTEKVEDVLSYEDKKELDIEKISFKIK